MKWQFLMHLIFTYNWQQKKRRKTQIPEELLGREGFNVPKVKLNTSLKPEFSCGLANFSIEGVKPKDIVTKLNDKYKIIAVAMEVGECTWSESHSSSLYHYQRPRQACYCNK